jgi:hypothetical protein
MAKQSNTSEIGDEWFSSYGLFTAESILGRFNIKLSRSDLIQTLKGPNSRYHYLVTVPVKNIFNGILISQVHDCQLYAQKMLIDYKLSSNKTADDEEQSKTQAEVTLTTKQESLIQLGDMFEEKKEAHYQLLSSTQNWLITEASKQTDLAGSPELAEFGETAEQIRTAFQDLRTEFRTLSVDVRGLLELLPDYQVNTDKLAQHQVGLDFNTDTDISQLIAG